MSIRPLSAEVIAQIRSSTAITSLNGVIGELLKNSLDAGAQNIIIDVDFGRGGCVVEDDGLGIIPSEFTEAGGLGKEYHTSKANTEIPIHGHHGRFLTSLSGMALVTITSHHHQYNSLCTLIMHKSQIVSRQVLGSAQAYILSPTHGTKVTVRDLFGTMPVRVKQRAIIAERQRGNLKEWDDLKLQVVLILLSWNRKVSVTLRGKDAHQKMVLRSPDRALNPDQVSDKTFVCSILSQAALVPHDDKSTWVSINASTSNLVLSGAISLKPSATKSTQFLSLGIYPLFAAENQGVLHDEINRLFSSSNFGKEEEAGGIRETERRRQANDARFKSNGYTNKDLKGGKKGIDCWPKFYIRIDPSGTSKELTVIDILDHRGHCLSLVIKLLQAMIFAFLTKYHFLPNALRQQSKLPEEGEMPQKHGDNGMTTGAQYTSRIGCNAAEAQESLQHYLKASKPTQRLSQPGINLQIPLLQRSSIQPSKPFDTWLRIKSGAPVPHPECPGPDDPPSLPEQLQKPATARRSTHTQSPLSIERSAESKSLRLAPPLLSKNGQLVRKPFGEIATRARSQPAPHSFRIMRAVGTADDTKLWINPITKARSFVNTRTGITVRESPANQKPKESRDSAISTQRRLDFRQDLVSTLKTGGFSGSWLTNVLKNWENPVFQPSEMAIPTLPVHGAGALSKSLLHDRNHHCSQANFSQAFKLASASLNGRISKGALKLAEVISQIDNKFILVKANCSNPSNQPDSEFLVMIDQHAADERVRVESLMQELCTPSNWSDPGLPIAMLDRFIVFEVAEIEADLLRTHYQHFANWGILYNVAKATVKQGLTNKLMPPHRVVVQSLPLLVQERCKQEPKLLIDLIRAELWKVSKSNPVASAFNLARSKRWPERIHNCPQGLIDMLNSRACRSAIMFNDILTRGQSESLVKRLADCDFPFQCAHGRPSLVPLVDIGYLRQFSFDDWSSDGREGFGTAFRSWKRGLV